MSLPSDRAWRDFCDSGIAALERLRRDGPGLFDRAKQARRDGFPGTSPGLEAHGTGGKTDPVGDLAAAVLDGELIEDPVRNDVRTMRKWVEEAIGLLWDADGKRADSLPPRKSGEGGEPGCIICARVRNPANKLAVWSPIKAGTGSRCSACYEWWRTHDGMDRPTERILADLAGKRRREKVPPPNRNGKAAVIPIDEARRRVQSTEWDESRHLGAAQDTGA